ncbi:hypothetical protein VTO42DRAFT_3295 [Malbranchea cinnamomea]
MVSWNAETDAKLLMAIIKTAKPKIDHEAVAKYMGCGVTAYAVQHRLRKLNAKANGEASERNTPVKGNGNVDNPANTTPTPSSRKRNVNSANGGAKVPVTPTRKRVFTATQDAYNDDKDNSAKKLKKVIEEEDNGDEDCA